MHSTLLFNRSSRTRIRFTGAKAVETINGLVTNDLIPLAAGQGCYACILTAKSKILADVRIFKISPEELLLDAAPECGAGLPDFFKKYVNPRLAKFEDISAATGHITIATEITSGVTEIASDIDKAKDLIEVLVEGSAGTDISATLRDTLQALPPYSHLAVELWGIQATLVRTPELGQTTTAFDLITGIETLPELISKLNAAGVKAAGEDEWETRRIQIGWPKWGTDMDDTTFPQEANMVELNAISFTKGCYIGQETVARIHYRGHVNKFLRVVEVQPAEANTGNIKDTEYVNLSTPAPVFSTEGKEVGTITSIAGTTGIAMIRREIEDGTELTSGTTSQPSKTLSDAESTAEQTPALSTESAATPYKVTVKKTAQGLA